MTRFVLLLCVCIAPAGCLDWQGTYDSAARTECRAIVNAEERQACLSRVENNSVIRRAERRDD